MDGREGRQQLEEANSVQPTFALSELSSVHEQDWRYSGLDGKTVATLTLDQDELYSPAAEVEVVDEPYSEWYLARQNERSSATKSSSTPQPKVSFEPRPMSDTFVRPTVCTSSAMPTQSAHNYWGDSHYRNNNGQAVPTAFVPNRYSAHYDPAMPDWEGVTIAEHTMDAISTVTPPPDDFYGPYTPPVPVAMVAAATPGIPWDELDKSHANRDKWRNPNHDKIVAFGAVLPTESEISARKNRKLLWGLIGLVVLLVVVVSVVVPLSLNAVHKRESYLGSFQEEEEKELKEGMPISEDNNISMENSPTLAPTIENNIIEVGATTTSPTAVNSSQPSLSPIQMSPEENVTPSPAIVTKPAISVAPSTAMDDTISDDSVPTPTPTQVIVVESSSPTTPIPSPVPTTQEAVSTNLPITIITSDPTWEPTNPTHRPTSKPTTKRPTRRPTSEPTTKRPTRRPSSQLSTDDPTPSPSLPPNTSSTSDRDMQWLEAHNIRREEYHTRFGKTYVPLVWSDSLASQAKDLAKTLASNGNCEATTEGREDIGQIAYMTWSTSYKLETPDEMLSYWVEDYENYDYPDNEFLTQVIWRPTKYLGCGDSVYDLGDRYCRIFICNYIRPGNCGMSSYSDWRIPMLMDDSSCGLECPEEGCFWESQTN